jgi:carboxyl-terminal processing protease
MKFTRRFLFLAPLTVVAFAFLGGVFAPLGSGVSAASSDEDEIRSSVGAFTKVYSLVERNFSDPLDPDKALYRGAIPGMLRTLDPHSSFFDPRDFQLLREDQRGQYFGVGMKVGARNNRTMVMEIFTASPAYKAGLKPGDSIIEVSGKNTAGLSTSDVADLLKGPRGTVVQVVVMRPGHNEPLSFDVTRDAIPRKSVPDAFFVRPGIAYVQITQFNETTSREMKESLKQLGEQNIKGLILDVRGNPGGLLNEAVAVSNHFLQKGQVIVSHRGRASAERQYTALEGSTANYPIVVMVNRYSASAAEIVAGALQDHDRGWVLGDNTFGKGLVQTVYTLSENTGLALTTAKYYTPSGRLIQRDYSSISFFDYYYRKNVNTQNSQDVKMTDSGRTVYGGGGIAPDEKYTPPKANRFQEAMLLPESAFFNFTAKYFGTRSAKLPRNWEPDSVVEDEFHNYLIEAKIPFTEADYAQNHDWVKAQLKREMYAYAFTIDEANRVAVETDPEVAKAVESMPKARALLENAKRLLAQRSAKQTD